MTVSWVSSGMRDTNTGIVSLYACLIDHQKPPTMQLLPGATRTHPHVADGNRVPSVSVWKQSKSRPCLIGFREPTPDKTTTEGGGKTEERQCSFMSNSWFCLSCPQNKLFKLKRIICILFVPFMPAENLLIQFFKHSISQQVKKKETAGSQWLFEKVYAHVHRH